MSRQKKPLDEYESAGPMTRQRLKRQREGSEEDIWGNRNKGNSNNKKRIDITPLDALTIASSMLNCSYTAATEGAFDESGGVCLVNVGTITVMDDLDKNPHPNPHKVSDSTRPFSD